MSVDRVRRQIFIYSITVVATLMALCFVFAASSPAMNQQTAPAPYSVNPYCDGSPGGSVPIGPIECPPDHYLEPACMAACASDYSDNMDFLYDFACGEFDSIEQDYQDELDYAYTGFVVCVLGSDQYTHYQCDVNYLREQKNARTRREQRHKALDDAVEDLADSFSETYFSCASGCCKPIKRIK